MGVIPSGQSTIDTNARDRIRMDNGSVAQPNLIKHPGVGIDPFMLDMPGLSQSNNNNLSVYHKERSKIAEFASKSPVLGSNGSTVQEVNGNVQNNPQSSLNSSISNNKKSGVEDDKLLMKYYRQVDELKTQVIQLEQEKSSLSSKLKNAESQIELMSKSHNESQTSKNEQYKYMLEAQNLKKEVDSLKYFNSKLENEKNALSKALADSKLQRDQMGVQRMQVVGIRNFLLAIELERIRMMYLEKEKECEQAKVRLYLSQNAAALSRVSYQPVEKIRYLDRPVQDERSMIDKILLSIETMRLSKI